VVQLAGSTEAHKVVEVQGAGTVSSISRVTEILDKIRFKEDPIMPRELFCAGWLLITWNLIRGDTTRGSEGVRGRKNLTDPWVFPS
jgi:hypothetical protein